MIENANALPEEDLELEMQVLIDPVTHVQIFNDDICTESVQELINILNQYEMIDLFFSTNGGETAAMEALVHYLNKRKADIKIYLTYTVASAGADLLTDCECEIFLADNLDYILIHAGDRYTNSVRKSSINQKELKKQLLESNRIYEKKYEALGLTPKEIRTYKRGEDVILYRKDFNRLNINQKDF